MGNIVEKSNDALNNICSRSTQHVIFGTALVFCVVTNMYLPDESSEDDVAKRSGVADKSTKQDVAKISSIAHDSSEEFVQETKEEEVDVDKIPFALNHNDSMKDFVNKINESLQPNISKFQEPFCVVIRVLKNHVLNKLGFEDETKLNLSDLKVEKKYPDMSSHWIHTYEDPALGTTTCTFFKNNMGAVSLSSVNSKPIVYFHGLGVELTISYDDELSCKTRTYDDYSGAYVEIKDKMRTIEYTNNKVDVFGKGSFNDSFEDKMWMMLPKNSRKFGLGGKPNNIQEHQEEATILGELPSISWKEHVDKVKKIVDKLLSTTSGSKKHLE